MPILKESAPVSISIDYQPYVTKEEPHVTRLWGTAHYTFTNLTDTPINVAFPPTRVFTFGSMHLTRSAEVPEFAMGERVVTIPGGKSLQFEDLKGQQILGDIRYFFEGGPGWMGFVFSQPSKSESDVPFCTGTVFSTYQVHPVEKTW